MKNKKFILGVILLAGFVVMFTLGAKTSEIDIVLKKATQICMECIGIG